MAHGQGAPLQLVRPWAIVIERVRDLRIFSGEASVSSYAVFGVLERAATLLICDKAVEVAK